MECYEKLTGQWCCEKAGMVRSRGHDSRGLAVAAAVNHAHLAFGTVENQLQPDAVVLQKEFFVSQFGMLLQAGTRFAADAVGGAHYFAADEVWMLLGFQRPFRHGDSQHRNPDEFPYPRFARCGLISCCSGLQAHLPQ